MKKHITYLLFLVSSFTLNLHAQNVTVSGALVGNGGYSSLSAAFTTINGSAQTGAVISITINASFTEVASAVLNNGAWTSVSIQPSGGAARTITSTFNPMIDFAGADYVTIDGLNSSSNSLTLDCSSTSNVAATIRFITDATYNTVNRCTIKGSSTGLAASTSDGGVVWFYNSTGAAGNDHNTISNSDIGPSGSNLPYMCIRSYGQNTTKSNDYNTIDNCTIHDFFHAGANGAVNNNGIYINNYNSNWTITNNKIYQSATRTFTAGNQTPYRSIRVSTSIDPNSGGFTISGNIIGYANSSGTGMTILTMAIAYSIEFEAIILEAGSSGANSTISNNTIAGIDITSARAPAAGATGLTNQTFFGIYVDGCLATVSNNIIGSTTGTGSIIIRGAQVSMGGGYCVCGIISRGSKLQTISGNTIGGISIVKSVSPAPTFEVMSFVGIKNENTTVNNTISGNTIGNSTANNITSNHNAANVNGIVNVATGGTTLISGNTIQNLNQSGANGGAATVASIIGIYSSGSSSNTYTITKNKIINCSNTSTTNVSVHGILVNQPGSGHSITQNLLYGLSVSTTVIPPNAGYISAIRIMDGTITVANNMISLGTGITNRPIINGIESQGASVIPNFYYNSIVITGNSTLGGSKTYGLNIVTSLPSFNIENNILYNDRISPSTSENIALRFSASQLANVTTCNYNDLYIGSTNTVLVSNDLTTYGTLAAWTSASGRDANSITLSPSFISLSSDLHISPYTCSFIGAGTAIAAVTVDYDTETRLSPPDIGADEVATTTTWTAGAGTTDWNTPANWSYNLVPIGSTYVVIPVVGSLIYPNISTADAYCKSLTINSGASLTMSNNHLLTLNATCSNSNFTNSGTFTSGSGTEEVIFSGTTTYTITIDGTATTSFNKLTLNLGAITTKTPTITKQLQINTNSYVSLPVTYGNASTLVYNPGSSYGVGNEWTGSTTTVGYGTPQNVTIQSATTINMPAATRGMAGNLNISSGTLNLNSTGFYDLYIAGNWTRDKVNGFFNPNCRAVFFTGTTVDQTITVSNGGGTEIFNYVIVDKSTKKLLIGTSTNMKVSATSACSLGNDYLTITNGDIDLQGRTLYFEGPTGLASGTLVMKLSVKNLTRSILSNVAGGIVNLTSTLNAKTLLVVDGGGSGKILFGSNVEVQDGSGEIDFGTGNLGTINYILRINNGGAVVGNAPYYAVGSTLIFSTGTSYDLVATQQVWETGTLGTTAGVPYNVDVNLAGTDVRTSDNLDRTVRNDFSILNGIFELGAPGFLLGNLLVGGDWLRNSIGTAFIPNTNKVTYNSTVNSATQLQTITMSGGGNEVYYDLEINNALGVTLSGTTNARITNLLTLNSGLVNTGSNEMYLMNSDESGIIYDASNNSADSWVNGYLRRAIILNPPSATLPYAFPVGTSTTASAAGYELLSLPFNSNSNIDNLLVSFTADNSSSNVNEPYAVTVNGTPITDRLNAGWWTIRPYNSSLALIAAPICDYDIYLDERGHTNSQPSPAQYTVIKRDASYCFDACATAWTQCGTHSNLTQTEIGGTAHAERSGYSCNSFSDWAIGFSIYPLPIELLDFVVNPVNNNAILTWSTASELNSNYFSVERSIDGKSFTEITLQGAKGYSLIPSNYSFTDERINELGTNRIYYRLRMVDLDQSYSYSQVRLIDLNEGNENESALVYPNPFSNDISVVWNSNASQTITIQLNDAIGRNILSQNVLLIGGSNVIPLTIPADIANGVYFINIISNSGVQSQKIIRSK